MVCVYLSILDTYARRLQYLAILRFDEGQEYGIDCVTDEVMSEAKMEEDRGAGIPNMCPEEICARVDAVSHALHVGGVVGGREQGCGL